MSSKISAKSGQTMARRWRRTALSALAALGLLDAQGSFALADGMDSRTLGVVAADEPHAALAARDILEAGGSVADAATALYFTLAVTYPVAGGLGGGGLCLHYNAETHKAQSINFLPRASQNGGAAAVPGAVRGFSYIQARYGRLSWSQDLAPAKRLAAAGFPMSHALAEAVAANADIVKKSPFLSDLFVYQDGSFVQDGDPVTQVSLATTLALISGRGPVGFYGAPFSTAILQAASRGGGAIAPADLYDYRAEEAEAAKFELGKGAVLAPAAQTGAGALAAQILPGLTGLADSHDGGQLGGAARDAVKAALSQFNVTALPRDFGSTGFLVADTQGEVMACGVTMSRPFGTGQEVEKTGFTLAPAPGGAAGLAGAFLMPLITTGPKDKDILFAGIGAGGPDAASAVSALAVASLAHDAAVLDPAWSAAEQAPGNSVNMLACSKGILSNLKSCKAAADPHGHGVALEGNVQSSGGHGFLGLF